MNERTKKMLDRRPSEMRDIARAYKGERLSEKEVVRRINQIRRERRKAEAKSSH